MFRKLLKWFGLGLIAYLVGAFLEDHCPYCKSHEGEDHA